MNYVHAARIGVHAFLLLIVWQQVHWSVAVLLSSLVIAHEATAMRFRQLVKRLTAGVKL